MVDIHHHLLWGLDDGARDFETSLAMARASAADGVTEVVCTPHANGNYAFNPTLNAERAAELQHRLDADGIKLKISLGCDLHLSYDNILEARENPRKFSINGLGYLMVEIPDYGVPRGLTETFYELQLVGLIPVLTHPERNPTLQSDPKRLAEWMRGGVLVQVTGDSVTGKMGKSAQKAAHDLLGKRWVHFIATDAHSVNMRPPRLSEARDLIARRYGREYAHSLAVTNPAAAVQGKPITPVAEPLGLYEDTIEQTWLQKLKFWGSHRTGDPL